MAESWDVEDLRSGASNDEDFALAFEHHGEQGIHPSYSARLAEEILAEPYDAPASDGPKVGPRRNRHLDGFGGRNNA
jgi:hypothetical protein